MTGGGSNPGNAVAKVATDSNMHDAAHPGSFAILITDGPNNCDSNEPATCISQVAAANSGGMPIKTFVVGLGAWGTGLLQSDLDAFDAMAQAGGVPCSGGFCKGHKFYPLQPDLCHSSTCTPFLRRLGRPRLQWA